MVLVFIGVAAGLGGAAALSRTLTAVLFEVSPYDPVSFAAVSAGLLGPARSAERRSRAKADAQR